MTPPESPPFGRLMLLRLAGAYMRHVPTHPGQWRIANWAVRSAPLLKNVRQPIVIRLREGFRFRVEGSSQTGRIAYATGRYEPGTTAIIKARVRARDTVVDVGANIGYFSIVAARAVGPEGRVLAFEPVPAVRASLVSNLRLNDLEQVDVHDEALGATTEDVSFYPGPTDDSGLASLRPVAGSDEVRVRQIRFDDLWDRASRVGLIKIDVEGAELRVLEGMTACLTRDRPDLILEFTDEYLKALGSSAASLLAFVTNHGYRTYEILETGQLVPVRAETDLATCPTQFNAFCTTNEDLGPLAIQPRREG
jgi:FkbM family methyltransferase